MINKMANATPSLIIIIIRCLSVCLSGGARPFMHASVPVRDLLHPTVASELSVYLGSLVIALQPHVHAPPPKTVKSRSQQMN